MGWCVVTLVMGYGHGGPCARSEVNPGVEIYRVNRPSKISPDSMIY